MFRYRDTDGSNISLHDCFARKMTLEGNTLTLSFPEGFWLGPLHPENPLDDPVRAEDGQILFQLLPDSIEFMIIRSYSKIFGLPLYKQWKPADFMTALNSGKLRLEFLSEYSNGSEVLFQCVLHSIRRPYYADCDINFMIKSIICQWNTIRYDRTM